MILLVLFVLFFFFNDTATTEIYTLSLHDALPILSFLWDLVRIKSNFWGMALGWKLMSCLCWPKGAHQRSEEHTSELQSRLHLVCRLLLEKKKYQLQCTL